MADEPVTSLPEQRSILNKAQLLLGATRRIDSVNDRDDREAENLLILWDIARRAAIALHPWNFALKRERVMPESDVEPIGYEFQYRLPTDCLRWLPWDRDSEHHFEGVEEGGFLLTNHAGSIVVRYVRDVIAVDRWSPLFVDIMAYTLAVEYCQGKTQLVGLRDRLSNERLDKLTEGYRVDGAASANRRRGPSVRNSGWAGARFNRNGTFGR